MLRQGLDEYAASLGIDLLRVTGPQTASGPIANHLKWLARRYGGDMQYLARNPEARYDARSLLPSCNSVIVTAHSYYVADDSWPAPGVAKVSRYAWGDDYHDVIRERLLRLAGWLGERVEEHKFKCTVDTSPLAEKAFAAQSGLGWAGRNSLILNEKLGSYFFIGLLLTSAELPRDSAMADGCGTCSACLRACPTGALSGPGVLDATKCISYLTTERKTAVEPGSKLNGWLYGCDTCQQCCPFNTGLPERAEPRWQPRPGIREIQASDAREMGEAEFTERFAGTVIKRRRLDRFSAQAAALLAEASAEGKAN